MAQVAGNFKLGGSIMSARKWIVRLLTLVLVSAVLIGGSAGCRSSGGSGGSAGSDGHAGHSH
jgi:hypothetical protein